MERKNVVDLFGQVPTITEEIAKPDNRHSLSGRYAEFMVCAYLTKMGLNVLHVDATGFDLILEYEGSSYRVNVKETGTTINGPFKQSVEWNAKKHFYDKGKKADRNITERDVDLLALFHTKFETVIFYPVVKAIRKVRFPLSFVRNSGNGEETLRAAIEKLNRR